MSNVIYIECAAGISGDMAVAALLDLGVPEKYLRDILATLPMEDPYEIKISRVKKSGLDTCDFDVILPKNRNPHDHDMTYLYGHLKGDVKEVSHSHGHQEHRGPKEIQKIFDASDMTPGAKKIAGRILEILTDGEAKAHNVPKDQVHFHEVGAVDSIIDIASFAICFDLLYRKWDVCDVIVKEITEGQGTVRCQHGVLPIPVPAVVNIAAAEGLRLHLTEVMGELVTPTGAAIAAAVKTKDRLPEACNIRAVGLGAGKRVYETSGFLRIFLLEH